MHLLQALICNESFKFLGIKILDNQDFVKLIVRFSLNLLFNFVIVRVIYFSLYKKTNYLFTYFLVGNIVFFLCFLLESVKLELGFALGLFAIFGILRYRTETIPIKEMTYLFIVIGLCVINALANKKISYTELIFTNLAIVAFTYGIEKIWFQTLLKSKSIVYNSLELISPHDHEKLMLELSGKLGLKVQKVKIGKVNFAKNEVQITVMY